MGNETLDDRFRLGVVGDSAGRVPRNTVTLAWACILGLVIASICLEVAIAHRHHQKRVDRDANQILNKLLELEK